MKLAEGQSLPPAVIKAVAATNDRLLSGSVSVVENGVYSNCGLFLVDLTSDALWFYLYDVHDARVWFKKELDKLLASEGITP
jgi:hypothetical protein